MKAKVTISSLVLIIMFCFNSCKQIVEDSYRIWFKNESSFVVNVERSYNFPDTNLFSHKPKMRNIGSNEKDPIEAFDPWDEIFENEIQSDTLIIFVFNKDTLDYYSWDTIREKYKILHRYDLSLQDLKEDGMYVYYPPK
jgi:hypothetical protein